jgi:hypothetical protein
MKALKHCSAVLLVLIIAATAARAGVASAQPTTATTRAEQALSARKMLPAGAKAVDVGGHVIAVTVPKPMGGVSSIAAALDGALTTTSGPGYQLMWPDAGLRPSYNLRATTGPNVLNALWWTSAASNAVRDQTGVTFTYVGQYGTSTPAAGEITVTVSDSSPCAGGWACAIVYKSGMTVSHAALFFSSSAASHSALPATAAHELGHAMGLGHFNEVHNGEYQRMYFQSRGETAATYKSGDAAGLRYMAAAWRFSPRGHFDGASGGTNAIGVSGWAIDPETDAAIGVRVFVDGVHVATPTANAYRPDVSAAFPKYSSYHGLSATVSASAGTRQVCLTAVNVSRGADVSLGCRTVTVTAPATTTTPPPPPPAPSPTPTSSPDPFGALESVRKDRNGLSVTGWAIDPDTSSPISVRVVVDGVVVSTITANLARTDLGQYQLGTMHGFQQVIAVTKGAHQVCVVAVNVGAGADKQLGCQTKRG